MRDQIIFAGVGTLLTLLGVPLAFRQVRPNGLYGLRTPAIFAHEQVWYEANAACGRDLIAFGSVLIVLSLALPYVLRLSARSYVYVYTALLVIGIVGIAVRGWREADRLWGERRSSDGGAAA
jgi:uncharacterized membrane protein